LAETLVRRLSVVLQSVPCFLSLPTVDEVKRMPTSTARQAIGERAPSELFEHVTCPFCGLLCDDLEVERNGQTVKLLKNGCPRAEAGFERRLPPSSPMVGAKEVELSKAVGEAAALIRKAALPLYGGLATDVAGMRAAMALAERSGGIVDHVLSDAQYTNFRVLQTGGWITSTLTETRNRADLIVIVGSDVHKLHPRFFERIVCPPDSMFDTASAAKRVVVFLGKGLDSSAAMGPRIGEVVTIPCALEDVGEVLSVLRARLHGSPVPPLDHLAGVSLADIDVLVEQLRTAKYGVMVWAPPNKDFPRGELMLQQMTELVKDLNKTTRVAGLPLGGNEGAVTAGAVSTWQSGFPLRMSYASGAPDYDPYRYAISRMLGDGEGDVLVWIASITPNVTPPKTDIPTIVLGTPGLKLAETPAVFIPVGTPGVDHAGRLVRCDSVVSLPLTDLGRAPLPRTADVLAAIEAAL
jgi:formylmethanofuran dehydrogenase subunit B